MISGRSPKKSATPPSVLDAVYRTVHDYGADRLAGQTGQSQGVIDNKANPHATTLHLPTLPDVMVWQTVTGDHRILHAMAHALGEVCFAVPDVSDLPGHDLLGMLTKMGSSSGHFHQAIHDAMRDGVVTRKEFALLHGEGMAFISAIAELVRRMEGMADV